MDKLVKRLTYQQFDKQEDNLREDGWKVTEVKADFGIVVLEKHIDECPPEGVRCCAECPQKTLCPE